MKTSSSPRREPPGASTRAVALPAHLSTRSANVGKPSSAAKKTAAASSDAVLVVVGSPKLAAQAVTASTPIRPPETPAPVLRHAVPLVAGAADTPRAAFVRSLTGASSLPPLSPMTELMQAVASATASTAARPSNLLVPRSASRLGRSGGLASPAPTLPGLVVVEGEDDTIRTPLHVLLRRAGGSLALPGLDSSSGSPLHVLAGSALGQSWGPGMTQASGAGLPTADGVSRLRAALASALEEGDALAALRAYGLYTEALAALLGAREGGAARAAVASAAASEGDWAAMARVGEAAAGGVAAESAARTRAEAALAALRAEHEGLRAQFDGLSADHETLLGHAEAAEEGLRAALAEGEEATRAGQVECDCLRAEVQGLRAEREVLLEHVEAEVRAGRGRAEELAGALQAAQGAVDDARERAEGAEGELTDACGIIDCLRAEVKLLRAGGSGGPAGAFTEPPVPATPLAAPCRGAANPFFSPEPSGTPTEALLSSTYERGRVPQTARATAMSRQLNEDASRLADRSLALQALVDAGRGEMALLASLLSEARAGEAAARGQLTILLAVARLDRGAQTEAGGRGITAGVQTEAGVCAVACVQTEATGAGEKRASSSRASSAPLPADTEAASSSRALALHPSGAGARVLQRMTVDPSGAVAFEYGYGAPGPVPPAAVRRVEGEREDGRTLLRRGRTPAPAPAPAAGVVEEEEGERSFVTEVEAPPSPSPPRPAPSRAGRQASPRTPSATRLFADRLARLEALLRAAEGGGVAAPTVASPAQQPHAARAAAPSATAVLADADSERMESFLAAARAELAGDAARGLPPTPSILAFEAECVSALAGRRARSSPHRTGGRDGSGAGRAASVPPTALPSTSRVAPPPQLGGANVVAVRRVLPPSLGGMRPAIPLGPGAGTGAARPAPQPWVGAPAPAVIGAPLPTPPLLFHAASLPAPSLRAAHGGAAKPERCRPGGAVRQAGAPPLATAPAARHAVVAAEDDEWAVLPTG